MGIPGRKNGAKMALLTDERYTLCPIWQRLVRFWPQDLVALTRASPVLLKIFPKLEAIWLKADPNASFDQLLERIDSLGARGQSCFLIVCLDEATIEQIKILQAHSVSETLFNAAVLAEPMVMQNAFIRLETQRQRLEVLDQQISRQQKMLQNKSDFLSWLSHEIRTPMNGVLGMIDLLQRTPLTMDQQEMTEVIGRSGRRVVDLLSEILDINRLEAGKMSQKVEPFQLRQLIEDSISLYARDANLRGLVIGNLVDADVPDSLQGDERKLGQILNNLISNAVKFTSKGHVLILVRIEAWEGEHCRLLFEVQDSGHGIASDEFTKVFAPFEQTNSSHLNQGPSSGLGLSLTKNLVELLGGSIHLRSRLGEGSTFSFSLPFLVLNMALPLVGNEFKAQTAVVVSNNSDRAHILRQVLERGGLRVMVTHSQEAPPDADWYFFGGREDWDNRHQAYWQEPGQKRVYVLRNPMKDRREAKEDRSFNVPGGLSFIDLPLRQSDLYRRMETDHSSDLNLSRAKVDLSKHNLTFRGAHILVVDDDPVNLKVAERQLKRLEADITLASSAIDALEHLEKKHFDLIFVDCHMPHMDGFEFVTLLRTMPQLSPGTPVVALTAMSQDEDRDRALRLGFSDFLAKPAHLDEIEKILGRWLPSDLK